MRRALWTATLLLLPSLLALAPVAGAAEAPLLTDAEGDSVVRAGPDATELPVPLAQDAQDADLLALSVEETDDDLRFLVAVKALAEESPGAWFFVTLDWGGQAYRVQIQRWKSPLGGEGLSALLQYEDGGGDWSTWAWIPVEMDLAASTLATRVPKLYLMDPSERVPGKGDALEGITVASRRPVSPVITGSYMPNAYDEMGFDAPAAYTLQKGDFATGSLRLHGADRVRVSNGGATTFVFKVDVGNVGQAEEEYALSAVDLPAGWQARVQSPIRVPAGETRTVAVLASVPFAHDHGGFDSFNLTVQAQRDPASQGRMRLAVLHTPIPQPSGHHPDLYLHAWQWSGDPLSEAYQAQTAEAWPFMSTIADHEGDAPEVAPNVWSEGHAWSVWLNPGLRMGLDFDLDKTGTLAGSLVPKADGAATLEARLWYWTWDGRDSDRVLLAEGGPIDLAMARDQKLAFEVPLAPTPESDYVPYTRNQNVQLELVLTPASGAPPMPPIRPDPLAPRLQTADFKLSLPLLEYHDRLSGDAVGTSTLDLVADGPVEKAARPGTVVTYAFELRNPGATDLTVDLDPAGGDAAAGALAPASRITVPAAGTARVTLAVQVPSDAAEGQALEVLVFAHAADDPTRSAVARTKTTVTLGEGAVADERATFAAAQEQAETPGAGWLGALAAIAAAAWAARRRG